jgi:hypothetical protein
MRRDTTSWALPTSVSPLHAIPRCLSIHPHRLLTSRAVGPEIAIRLRYDERYAIQPHSGAWSVVYTVEFGKKSPWVEADHRSLVSAVSKVLGRVGE